MADMFVVFLENGVVLHIRRVYVRLRLRPVRSLNERGQFTFRTSFGKNAVYLRYNFDTPRILSHVAAMDVVKDYK